MSKNLEESLYFLLVSEAQSRGVTCLSTVIQWFCGGAQATTDILTHYSSIPSTAPIGKYNTLLLLNSKLSLPAFPPMVFQGQKKKAIYINTSGLLNYHKSPN